MSQFPLPPLWYYDGGDVSASGNPSSSEALVGSYIRDSANTIPHSSSPWSLHHQQVIMPVSQSRPESPMNFPGPSTLQSTSRYEASAIVQQKRNAHTTQQKRIPLLHWDNNKEEMKRFYMDQDHTLPELVEYMETLGFRATQRQYKEQFKKWKWSKNLTGDTAVFMRAKASQRKQQNPPKDTVFHWHGKNWTTDQVLRDGNVSGATAFEHATPQDVSYQTPYQTNIDEPSVQPEPHNISSVQNTSKEGPAIRLRWNGYKATDIEVLLNQAVCLEQEKDIVRAEEDFKIALDACYHLYPPAHDLTVEITYRLALLYGEQSEMEKADHVLDQLTNQMVSRWGWEHETTVRHYLVVARLLEAWDRHEDFINIIKELIKNSDSLLACRESDGIGHQSLLNVGAQTILNSTRLSNIIVNKHALSPPQVLLAVEKNNSHIMDVNSGINLSLEDMFDRLLDKLAKSPKDHMIDIIRVQTVLFRLHNKSDQSKKDAICMKACESAFLLCGLPGKKGLAFCQAAIDFVAECFELWYQYEAMKILEVVEEIAAEENEPEDPGLISLMIRIGKMLQVKTTWKQAAPRFEQAYAASISAFGYDSPVTRRLELGLEERHYSNKIDTDFVKAFDL